MYQYLYDNFLSAKKYDKTLAKIESKLIDLGIKGQIHKLTVLKNFESYLKEITDKNLDSLVVVGDDSTIIKVLNIIVEKEIVLGIIPIGKKNMIADFFGIPKNIDACDTLAARKIEEIDLGKIGGQFFLSSVEAFGEGVSILCNNQYEIKTLSETEKIGFYNLCFKDECSKKFNPQDGQLEIISNHKETKSIFKKQKNDLVKTILKVKKAKILSSEKSNSVLVDGQKIIKTPVEVEVADKKLKVIVGKRRNF